MGRLFYGCRKNLPFRICELGLYSRDIGVTSRYFGQDSEYIVAALVNGGDRLNSDEDFLTAILYTPALRRVNSVPDSHSEFSELSADLPESRSFLREISTGFRLTQRLHLKWNPST